MTGSNWNFLSLQRLHLQHYLCCLRVQRLRQAFQNSLVFVPLEAGIDPKLVARWRDLILGLIPQAGTASANSQWNTSAGMPDDEESKYIFVALQKDEYDAAAWSRGAEDGWERAWIFQDKCYGPERDHLTLRYRYLVEAMWHSKKINRRLRFQILALRVSKENLKNEEKIQHWNQTGIGKQNLTTPMSAGFVQPVAMRAVAAHRARNLRDNDPRFHDVVCKELMSHPIAPPLAERFGGCFHLTCLEHLASIIEKGIK